MEAYDEDAAGGKVDLIYGRVGRMIDEAAKMSGLTQKQYRDWGKIECMDTNTRNSRGDPIKKEERQEGGEGESSQRNERKQT